jgi:uncharacterized protein (TIGR03435 family)
VVPAVAAAVSLRHTFLLAALGLAPALAPPLAAQARAGDPAPPLAVEAVVQGGEPAALAPAVLAGKAVIVEFWATWCAPCIGALPHWNALVEQFGAGPVRFVSISDETAEKVRPFLAKRPIAGIVALDTDRSVFTAYGVKGIPHTVLIDRNGVVRAVTRPDAVDARAVRDLLAGKTPQVPEKVDVAGQLEDLMADPAGGPEPLVQALVRPAAGGETMMSAGPRSVRVAGAEALAALSIAFDLPERRIVVEAPLPEGRFDLAFATPGGEQELAALMQLAVPAALGVEARRERRTMDVLVLSLPPGGAPRMPTADGRSGFKIESRFIRGDAMPISSLAFGLEHAVDRPVVDETGLDGSYAVDLTWKEGDLDSLREAVRRQLGLELTPAQREVELLVVRPRPTDGS